MIQSIQQFTQWLDEAKACGDIVEPTAMALATATRDGTPSVRMVLLKGHDERGFVWYSNVTSRKGQELKENTQASLCFYWGALHRQVRVEGVVSPVSDAEADDYFHSRPRGSQIAACVSKQSAVIAAGVDLKKLYDETEAMFEGTAIIPRPVEWSGWRLAPTAIEFWQEGPFRMHERTLYTQHTNGWRVERLYP